MTRTEQTIPLDPSCPELAGTAMERARLHGLLATIFGSPPDVDLLVRLRATDFLALLADSGLDIGEDFSSKPVEALREELSVEYTRLFCGPGKHISPHESVQLKHGSGSLWGEETVLVRRFIEAAGFDYESDFNGIPDHVSVELEFLSRLAENESRCWQSGDLTGAGNALEWQLDFINRHAGKWMPGFCRKVASEEVSPFYRIFADLLRQFLAGEKADISDRLRRAFPEDRVNSRQAVSNGL